MFCESFTFYIKWSVSTLPTKLHINEWTHLRSLKMLTVCWNIEVSTSALLTFGDGCFSVMGFPVHFRVWPAAMFSALEMPVAPPPPGWQLKKYLQVWSVSPGGQNCIWSIITRDDSLWNWKVDYFFLTYVNCSWLVFGCCLFQCGKWSFPSLLS